jgi:lipopolysaccharide/colanic/teichoic acid biosynthesis glycosyltransferase
MIRISDVIFSFFGLLLLSPFICTLWIIGFFDTAAPIFAQERGKTMKKVFFV